MRNRFLKYESKADPVASRAAFLRRLGVNFAASGAVVALSLLAGMLGYAHFEGMGWVDAFANAAMILSGMGPLTPMNSTGGKLFAGSYALYSGLLLILVTGIMLAPVAHRVLHRFHLEEDGDK